MTHQDDPQQSILWGIAKQRKIDRSMDCEVFRTLRETYPIVGVGSTRIVFQADRHTVIKYPMNESGDLGNKIEAKFSDKDGPFPTIRVFHQETFERPGGGQGVIIWTEKVVNPTGFARSECEWIDMLDDGSQVGFSRIQNRVVAYDLGYEPACGAPKFEC